MSSVPPPPPPSDPYQPPQAQPGSPSTVSAARVAADVAGPATGLLVTAIVGGFFQILGLLFNILGAGVGTLTAEGSEEQILNWLSGGLGVASAAIGLLIAGLWISALVYYLISYCLGMRSGMRTLFRMYAYTESAVVFRLIPGIGGLAAEIYRIVLLVFGFKKVYRCGTGQALTASILPALILMLFAMVTSGFSLYYLVKA